MPTPLRRRIRHARRAVGYGALVVLIGLAVAVGVANQLLPWVEQHPETIASWLSERVGEPVKFSHAKAAWTRRGPRFTLEDLHVGEGANVLNIGRAQLQVQMYSWVLPDHPLTELKVRELSLTLVQDDDGRWRAIGLPGQGGRTDPLDRLKGFGELQIEKARLAIRSPQLKLDMQLPRVDVRVRVNGSRLRVGATAWANASSSPILAVLDMQRNTRNGRLWIGGENIELAQWRSMLAPAGIVPKAGIAQLGLWVTLGNQRVQEVTAALDLKNLALDSLDSLMFAPGVRRKTHARFERLLATLRWQQSGATWRLHAPVLNITQGMQIAQLDGLRLQGGEHFAFIGDQLDLFPLASILSLSDRLPSKLRVFLAQSQPQAVLRDVFIHGQKNGPLQGSLRVTALKLQAYAQHPGLTGLGGRIQFDDRGGVMRLDTTPVHVQWPAAFRDAMDLHLKGTLTVWKSGPGWTLGTTGLYLRGENLAAQLRAELGFQGDGSAPTLNLAADLGPTTFQTAKKFWLLNKMSAATVQWLNDALVKGEVLNGRIALGGDLDDWPFRHAAGNFDARAQIKNATLHFHDQWPAGQQMDADLTFNSTGFTLEGTAQLLGNRITQLIGGIEDFHTPWLTLDIAANGSGEKLRELISASPLNKEYGEHVKAVKISGNTEVALTLKIPLKHELGEKNIDGSVNFSRVRLADSRWGIAFTEVNGRTHFTHNGFATENLQVRMDGQPGIFNLRVGDFTDDPIFGAVATLEGQFTGQTLIKRYESLDWLKPWMNGSSAWQVEVRIPKAMQGQKTPPAQLHVNSDLVGTALTFPAPLNKASTTSMPLELQTTLPIDAGEMNLRLGTLLRLRGNVRNDQTLNGTLQFGEGAIAPAPDQGLTVRGNVPVLDAIGWVGFSAEGEGSDTLHDVDVQARQLQLIDYVFADTRLQLDRSKTMTHVRMKGTGIEGAVDIPTELSRGVQGKFSTLYLVSAAANESGPSSTTITTAPAVLAAEDPAKLPPLRFSIADLRMGQAQLGQAELTTTPIADGLRVDKFQTRASTLNLDAAGKWIRVEGGTRSDFRLDFNANSLGKMLDALGFVGMVQGGKTKASVTGAWPGSPGAFSLATMSGTLKVDIGTGRLLDVEPGGSGRVLGLISLAEIPRRLSLDFSDFFSKGFSFNTARGDFVFANGQAHTDNLHIDGPAAEIRVSGATGLRDQTYDQRVEVLPKAGGILPALGMLTGGPAGAAIGAMAQAVFQNPLKRTTRVVYHVTGPWKQPNVEVIERGPPKNATDAELKKAPAGN